MPVLKSFGSIKIQMFFEDHPPPHVHVTGKDFRALVRIEDAAVFRGEIPARWRTEILEWIAVNRVPLMARWHDYR